jgi:superfamily II DNA or RNA helicase
MNRVLTTKGYAILKQSLTPAQIEMIMKELTVTPKMNTKFASKAMIQAATFKVYRESPTRYYLPRAWATANFGPAESSVLPEGLPLPKEVEFKGTPYPYQIDIINKFLDAGANGLICVPCGKGKTFMALSTAARIGKRFLVVVDKEFLMNQWRGEMQSLMPSLRVGILQGPKREIDPALYDCTICMIQTLVGQEIPDGLFADYGFTIFDECHHLGAQQFSRSLQRIQTAKMLGLSATPIREDGLTKVFLWSLGEPVYWEKTREPDPTVVVKAVYIKSEDETYNTVPTDYRGETVMARLLGNILGCADRTAEIVRWIWKLLGEEGQGPRKILVLSERIGHLNEIEELLVSKVPEGASKPKISYYVGGMKEEVREKGAAEANVLLASYAMASEAMNIKTLNTVLLASPRKSVEQSTGRILRVRPSERTVIPVIVDFVDDHSLYKGQWMKRLKYYRTCNYTIESWDMGSLTGRKMRAAPVREAVPEEGGATACMIED